MAQANGRFWVSNVAWVEDVASDPALPRRRIVIRSVEAFCESCRSPWRALLRFKGGLEVVDGGVRLRCP